jgi:hypothetical protein
MSTVVGYGLASTGVIITGGNNGGGTGNGISEDNIVNELFTYDGINNTFPLTDPALKVLNVSIDNGTYPEYVPIGPVNDVTIEQAILILDNKINIQYIKA